MAGHHRAGPRTFGIRRAGVVILDINDKVRLVWVVWLDRRLLLLWYSTAPHSRGVGTAGNVLYKIWPSDSKYSGGHGGEICQIDPCRLARRHMPFILPREDDGQGDNKSQDDQKSNDDAQAAETTLFSPAHLLAVLLLLLLLLTPWPFQTHSLWFFLRLEGLLLIFKNMYWGR